MRIVILLTVIAASIFGVFEMWKTNTREQHYKLATQEFPWVSEIFLNSKNANTDYYRQASLSGPSDLYHMAVDLLISESSRAKNELPKNISGLKSAIEIRNKVLESCNHGSDFYWFKDTLRSRCQLAIEYALPPGWDQIVQRYNLDEKYAIVTLDGFTDLIEKKWASFTSCNYSPYKMDLAHLLVPTGNQSKENGFFQFLPRVPPGVCVPMFEGYYFERPKVYQYAKANDPLIIEELKESDRYRRTWNNKIPSWEGEDANICSNKNLGRACDLVIDDMTDFGRIKMSEVDYRFNGEIHTSTYLDIGWCNPDLKNSFCSVWTADDWAALSIMFNSVLGQRVGYEEKFRKNWMHEEPDYVMGITPDHADDPLDIGVSIKSVDKATPFGQSIVIEKGDLLFGINDRPIFSIEDLRGEIRRQGNAYSLERAFKYHFVSGKEDELVTATAALFFNPKIVGHHCRKGLEAAARGGAANLFFNMDSTAICRAPQAGSKLGNFVIWLADWENQVDFRFKEPSETDVKACRRAQTEAKWLHKQLCPDDYSTGALIGSFVGGVGSILRKGSAKSFAGRLGPSIAAEMVDEFALTLTDLPPGIDTQSTISELRDAGKLAILIGSASALVK